MATFVARVMTDIGVRNVTIDAPDQIEAEKGASKFGTIISIRRTLSFDLSRGMSATERNVFMLRLSSMIGSRMSTTEALRLLNSTFTGAISAAAGGMLQRIERGMSLPDAIDLDRKNFPVATAALIRAGTQSGETWKALRDAADFEYQIKRILQSSTKEVAAALVTFVVAAALMFATTEYLGPQVLDNPMFRDSAEVNVGWIEVLGKFMTISMMTMLFVFGIFVLLGTVGRVAIPNIADGIILKIPYYKDLVLSRNNYVILYKLGLLIRSGIRVEEALALTADGAPKGAMRTDVERALRAIRAGRTWAMAMETLHPTDRASLASSADREDSARTLDMLATQYRDLYIQRMQSFSPALQLVSALCLTIAGGVLFGLTILPMLQLAANFQ